MKTMPINKHDSFPSTLPQSWPGHTQWQGYPSARIGLGYLPHWPRQDWGTPPPPARDRTAEGVLSTPWAVCLLWSCRRTFLFRMFSKIIRFARVLNRFGIILTNISCYFHLRKHLLFFASVCCMFLEVILIKITLKHSSVPLTDQTNCNLTAKFGDYAAA